MVSREYRRGPTKTNIHFHLYVLVIYLTPERWRAIRLSYMTMVTDMMCPLQKTVTFMSIASLFYLLVVASQQHIKNANGVDNIFKFICNRKYECYGPNGDDTLCHNGCFAYFILTHSRIKSFLNILRNIVLERCNQIA